MISMSRRDVVVSSAAASIVLGIGKHVEIIGSAAAEEQAKQGFHKVSLGDAEIITVFDGPYKKPHDPGFIKNATVEETKAALREAGLADDAVPLSFTVTFLRKGGKLVMFDAGTGGQLAPTAGKLAQNMKAAGIDQKEIGTIVLTHFHPDHIFGLMTKDNAAVYPDAEIVVPSAEFAFWTDESVFGRIPEQNHGLAKRIQATLGKWKNVRRIDGGAEAVPGVTAVSSFGHTPGHTIYAIGTGEGDVLNLADTSNLPALFVRHPEWHAVFDMDAGMAEANRRKLFDRAIADRSIVTAYHWGMPGIGRMEKDGSGYAFVPLSV
jgi:glyoxylase-like metal-dependent hydrolase (beta-lactamase superfamily II)